MILYFSELNILCLREELPLNYCGNTSAHFFHSQKKKSPSATIARPMFTSGTLEMELEG